MKGLRSFLADMEACSPDEIVKISRRVNPRFQVSALVHDLEKSNPPIVIFENVEGFHGKLVCNLLSSRSKISVALGVPQRHVIKKLSNLQSKSLGPRPVGNGPVMHLFSRGKEVDLAALPIVTHFEKDAGPCITGAVTIIKAPATSFTSMGCYRLVPTGRALLAIDFSSETRQGYQAFKKAEDRNLSAPAAAVIGCHPSFLLGALSTTSGRGDKFAFVGGLMGQPVLTTKCETVDINVPANAEIVLEGEIVPHERHAIGRFGDYTGGYSQERKCPVMHVSAISMRECPIYHDVLPGYREHFEWVGTATASRIYREVSSVCTVRDVYLPPETYGESVCIISTEKQSENTLTKLLCSLKNALPYCIVVDRDVDVCNYGQVFTAFLKRIVAGEGFLPSPGIDITVRRLRLSGKARIPGHMKRSVS